MRRWWVVLAAALLSVALMQASAPARRGKLFFWTKAARSKEEAPTEARLGKLRYRNGKLRRRLAALKPKGNYIVVDTAANRLYLRNGDTVSLTAVVSSGSGNVLEEPGGKRSWVFDTPRGEFSVNSKLVNPDWVRPDWAFIEEGKALPASWGDRVESGVLGDYAMGFGNGYFIHGTLYKRLLGRNVTHGCVRCSDEDLKAVYQQVGIGTKIFVF